MQPLYCVLLNNQLLHPPPVSYTHLILAPGSNIIAANNNPHQSPYISFSGTSMASSIVIGAIALILEKYPDLDPQEVKLVLEMSCNSLHFEKNIQGKGMLDLKKLLSLTIR